jgi:hypothetical protein
LYDRGEHLTPAIVLSRSINWRDYIKEDLFLHEEDVQLLTNLHGAPSGDLAAMAENDGDQLSDTLLRASAKITIEDTLQYLLAATAQLLDAAPGFVASLLKHVNTFDVYTRYCEVLWICFR